MFANRRDFTLRYLNLDLGRAASFSNYAYNLKVLKEPYLDWKKGRNYCDAVFLSEILKFGPIAWINEPLASVRVHDENISTYSGVRDYKAYINWVRREFGDSISRTSIDEYQIGRAHV